MFASVNSFGLFGLNAFPVQVEISLNRGMPRFDIVGLAGTAVQESRERIKSALRSCGIAIPSQTCIVNLAPADQHKNGSMNDLPILIALLMVMGHVQVSASAAMIGEVSLNGDVRRVNGVLPMTLLAKQKGLHHKSQRESSLLKLSSRPQDLHFPY